jgi:hypothetical protein
VVCTRSIDDRSRLLADDEVVLLDEETLLIVLLRGLVLAVLTAGMVFVGTLSITLYTIGTVACLCGNMVI